MTLSISTLTLLSALTLPVPAEPTSRDAVLAFLALLDAETRSSTVLAWDHAARRRWYPSPGPRRPGLHVSAMTEAQRAALHRVLRSTLSTQGYLSVAFVMLNQDLIAEKFPGEDESSGKYSFAVYGDPAGDGLWSWRLGGHHVSLHFTYRGAELIATSPLFLGKDTVEDRTSAVRSGLRVFGRRLEPARALIDDLGERAKECRLASAPSASILPNFAAGKDKPAGGAVTAWPEADRDRLLRLALEFVRDGDSRWADRHEAALRRQRDALRFAWSGSATMGSELYYRITGSDFVFQLHYHDGHVHSMWTRADDFGEGL